MRNLGKIASFFGVLFLAVFLFGQTSSSVAQSAGNAPLDGLTPEQIEAAVPLLTDKEVRQVLISRLKASEAVAAGNVEGFNPAIFVYRLQRTLGQIGEQLTGIGQAVVELPGVFPMAWQRFTDARGEGSVAGFMGAFLIVLLVSATLEAVVGRYLVLPAPIIGAAVVLSSAQKAAKLSLIAASQLFRLAVFAGTAAAAYLLFFETSGQFRITFFFYLSAIMIFRLALVFSSAFFAPNQDQIRLPNYTNEDAKFFHRALGVTVALGGFGFFTCALFGTLGISGHVHGLMLIIVGTMTTAGLIFAAIRGRQAIAQDIAIEESASAFRNAFSKIWPMLYALIILMIWIGLVIAELTDAFVHYGAGLFTIGMFAVLPSLDAMAEREAKRYLDIGDDAHAAVVRTARILGWIVAVMTITTAWGIHPLSIAESGLGAELSRGLMQIGVTSLVAYVIWQVIRTVIDRKIAEEDAAAAAEAAAQGREEGGGEIGGAGLSRVRTLLPLFRRTVQIALSIVLMMIILASLGVDIGPVLAGAGVLGLAIGFGSQALVRDIVSGVFFLIDDAFRLGEYIDVGEVKGVVEKMSIRSLRLRHHRGAVHTVPFGEVKTLTNFSRDWAIMKLKFRVPFDTDVKKLKKIFKLIGQQLLENPDIAEDFIEPFKSQGVLEIDDYGLVIRAKFTAKPGRQFVIRKEAFVAIQKAFEENGIEFAKPVMRVSIEEDEDTLSADSKSAAGAAALTATQSKPAPA